MDKNSFLIRAANENDNLIRPSGYSLDQHDYIALVCLNNDELLAGTISCVRNVERPIFAEIAISVDNKYLTRGLGYRMLESLAKVAHEKKITHFYGHIHGENTSMLKLLEKYRFLHNIPSDSFLIEHKLDGVQYFEMSLR